MRRHVFIISSTDLVAFCWAWPGGVLHLWGETLNPSSLGGRCPPEGWVARDPWRPVRCWLAAPAPSSGWTSWCLWGCGQVVSTLKELQLILLGCRCTQFPLALEKADDLRSRASVTLPHRWVLTRLFLSLFLVSCYSETLGMKSSHMWRLSPLASVFWCFMRELPIIPYQLWMLPLTLCSLFAAAPVCFH